jgi:hypothetical protein
MTYDTKSRWDELFDMAISIIDQASTTVGHRFLWSFGGGTALMLQIDHRESHDIDLFLGDPQVLPFINPATQGYTISRQPSDYQTDGAQVTKLIFDDVGEIDFIVCADITDAPSVITEVRGRAVSLETPAEIVAKKVYYRGARLQPRDMFDIAAVAEAYGPDYLVAPLRSCGTEALKKALDVAQSADPQFVSAVIKKLMLREKTSSLADTSQVTTAKLLEMALTS